MLSASLIGNLHPAIVHLPIGILLLAGVLEWIVLLRRFRSTEAIIPLITGIGALSSVLACITGLTLAGSGDYDLEVVENHKWTGIFTALIACCYYVFRRKGGLIGAAPNRARFGSLLMIAAVTMTGHLGGNLTHGAGFLWKNTELPGATAELSTEPIRTVISDVSQARAYHDLVAPVMQEKCVACHGPSKQKGGLRLDGESHIRKGGKNGAVLTAGVPDISEMYKRMLLPPEDEYHMPPKEKPQLSPEDRTLIGWWITQGADFNRKVSEIGIDDSTLKILRTYQRGKDPSTLVATAPPVPLEKVAAADPALLESLRATGIVVLLIEPGNGYLQANLINAEGATDELLRQLEILAPQLIWLKLSGSDLSDAGCASLAKLTQLRRLQIDDTRVTDQGLATLRELRQLEMLNLSGDSITLRGLTQLKSMSALRTVNIWRTRITGVERMQVMGLLPNVRIDTGGYSLPFRSTDTLIAKEMPPK